MERNEKTTVSDLQPGDRFYKCKDKNKMVFEKVEHKAKRTQWQTYKHWCLWVGFADKVNFSDSAKEAATMAIKGDTEVIFLRHKEE